MKKNISINISGIIFHIEEDGYDKFKKYLDSINKYFASYEDSEEIIADIESRIAEIFLEKLDDGKQVISNEDVETLISTMGQISDFEAMEEETDFAQAKTQETKKEAKADQSEKKSKRKSTESKANSKTSNRPRHLERDTSNQLLGGVASGLAYYFNIDPIWTRILFILLFPTSISLFVYIILWIVLPGNDNLVEDETVKKFYRDPDDRVLGGVASGLANYFGTDAIVMRVIFIVLLIGGVGLLAYIVLWIIAPQAKSLTDKMQMKGEKVTLSNIDSNIKKSKEDDLNPKGENTFTTILLFPFRLIGNFFGALGKAIAPLLQFIVAVVRVFTGGIIAIVGISVMFSILVTAGVMLGLYNGDWFFYGDELEYFPYEVFVHSFPEVGILFLLTAVFIPFLYVFIAGITIIAKRKVMSGSVGWSILGIWMIAVVGTFATLPNVVRDFRDEGYYEESQLVQIEADTLIIGVDRITSRRFESRRFRGEFDYEWDSEFTDLDLRPSRDGQYKIDKRFRARGRTESDAERNAQDVTYGYRIDGATITFDAEITFLPSAEFRLQEVDVDFFIPKNQPFKIERETSRILRYFSYRHSWWEIYRNTWMFDDDGALICLTCEQEEDDRFSRRGSEYERILEVDPFNEVKVWDNLEVEISTGQDYELRVLGPRSKVERAFIQVSGETLSIDEDGTGGDWSDVRVVITAPDVRLLQLQNGAEVSFAPDQGDFLSIKVYDGSKAIINGNIDNLEVYITDNGRVDLGANITKLNAIVGERGRLYAYDASTREAEISTSSDGRARLSVSEYLIATANGFSSIRYKGNPEVNIKDKGNSASISQY